MNIQTVYDLVKAGRLEESALAIKQTIQSGESIAGHNISMANILIAAGNWPYVNALLPKNTNFFNESGWLLSLLNNRPLNSEGLPIPWFTYPAIDFLDGVVSKDWTVFEWGSGNSTLWWAQNVSQVCAVEDNEAWFNEIKSQIPLNVDYTYKNGPDYYQEIRKYSNKYFDIIVIDGSLRNECALEAASKIKDEGIIIFDNSDSAESVKSQQYFIDNNFYRIDFWGLIPSYAYKNCTSLFSKSPDFIRAKHLQSKMKLSTGISCFQAMDQNKAH